MKTKLVVTLSALCLGLLLMPDASNAMPNFARKYDKGCNMCHTQIPQLNKTGYEFRLAGYRLPDEIGQKEPEFKLGDFFAARLQNTYTYNVHKDVNPTKDSTTSQLQFKEVTLYPLTGSFGEYFGGITELSMFPDDVFEIENAYVRGVYGDENGWFQARLGIMHPWEGWGASDRPIGISRPLFQKQRATNSPFFLWNVDEEALEIGYYFAKMGTNISARLGNGILWKENGSGVAEPAQGGNLVKPAAFGGVDQKSYELVLNQIIGKESGFTVYYYTTAIPGDTTTTGNPYDSTGAVVGGPYTIIKLDRLALYANYYVLPKKLDLLVGYGSGKDTPDAVLSVVKSNGYYGEVDYFAVENLLAVGARYDNFDPSTSVDHNKVNAISVFANWTPVKGLQLIGEYQQAEKEQVAGGKNTDSAFQLLAIFIF
jgi:hypothetical protein